MLSDRALDRVGRDELPPRLRGGLAPLEQRATVTLQIDLIKNWSFAWPRLETQNFLMTIGSARPLEDAARIAYRELVRWMSADYGFDEIDAYMLLSQAGRIRLGNMVDPKYTMGASILKKYLVS